MQVARATRVTNLQRFGLHSQRNTLVLTFSTALDPGTATDLSNYSLVQFGHARPARSIPLSSASYDFLHHTVTLSVAGHIPLRERYQITVNGSPPWGVRGRTGLFLAGQHGQPGTNYVQDFGSEILAGSQSSGRDFATRPPWTFSSWSSFGLGGSIRDFIAGLFTDPWHHSQTGIRF
jgi:hypothetical protein